MATVLIKAVFLASEWHLVKPSAKESIFFLRFYLFFERREGREKERERNIIVWLPLVRPLLGTWPTTQACALTGNGISDSLVHKPVFNPLSYTSQGKRNLLLSHVLVRILSCR